jgi:hypothetical protein
LPSMMRAVILFLSVLQKGPRPRFAAIFSDRQV